MTTEPSDALKDRAAALLGWTPARWRPVIGGYTPAARYLVSSGVESAFVKVATTPLTAKMLRREFAAYQAVRGPFIPALIGVEDDPDAPMLIIEDLSGAQWPPPWDANRFEAALEQITALHATAASLRDFRRAHADPAIGWKSVAADPGPFLKLGLTSPEWLARSLPALIEAEANCPTAGTALTHFDLRSDNICLTASGAKLIDWAEACLGNPELDLGFWAPSLHFEGGPPPEVLLPNAPLIAAWVCGYFASQAGLATIPDAPFVRRVQREQLSTALPWAIRALKLGEA